MTTHTFQIRASQLVKLLGSVIKLASNDITTQRINAVLLRRQGNYLTATGTDRYVLGTARDYFDPNLDTPPDGWRFAIPLDDAKALLKLARASVKTAPVMFFEATELTLTVGYDDELGLRISNNEVTAGTFPNVGPLLFKTVSRVAATPSVGGLNLGRVAQFVDAGKLCGDRLGLSTTWWDASDVPRDGVDQPQWAVKIGDDFVGFVMGLRLAGDRDGLRDVSDWKEALS